VRADMYEEEYEMWFDDELSRNDFIGSEETDG
jgi:hypothetical protein